MTLAKFIAGRVLVVDDHVAARESVADILRQAGHQTRCASGAAEALQLLNAERYDLVVTDLQMPGMSGLDLVHQIERCQIPSQVVVVTAHATIATAVDAIRHGAFDYLEKPFNIDRLEQLASKAIAQNRALAPQSDHDGAIEDETPSLLGVGPAITALRQRIAQIARTSETVLIMGENGTGKELIARALHSASARSAAPLVSLNCPVLSAQLMESELFGHERGAFTSADAARAGRFEMADRGTILLDEITEIELGLQAKLLRVLQERSFERVGSSRTQQVDVRVLATTNRDLSAEVAAGRFRQDLYYRLAVLPLVAPPLRERPEDILLLAEYFLRRAAQRLGRAPSTLCSSAHELLMQHRWPGNVRELENLMTRATVLDVRGEVAASDLQGWVFDGAPNTSPTIATPPPNSTPIVTASREGASTGSLESMERELIESTLERFDGHRARTAEALGIGLRTLTGKLKQYGYAPRAKSRPRMVG